MRSCDSEKAGYDREKYRDMLLDEAEAALGTLGCSRKMYGYKRKESPNWVSNTFDERREEALRETTYEKQDDDEKIDGGSREIMIRSD